MLCAVEKSLHELTLAGQAAKGALLLWARFGMVGAQAQSHEVAPFYGEVNFLLSRCEQLCCAGGAQSCAYAAGVAGSIPRWQPVFGSQYIEGEGECVWVPCGH